LKEQVAEENNWTSETETRSLETN